MKQMLVLLGVFLFFLVSLILLAYFFQEKLIFAPEKLPKDYAFGFESNYKERIFQVDEKTAIHSLYFKAEQSKGVVLYFHGNAGSLKSWGHVGGDFTKYHYDVLVMDFRGYGKSEGNIRSEAQLYRDAQFIYDELKKDYPENKIVVYGRSIGTGIASFIAQKNSPCLLILETPYFNLPELVKELYPKAVTWILRYRLSNNLYIKTVACPVILIHGTQDELIPYEHSVRLSKLKNNISFVTINGGGHSNLADFEEYHRAMKKILDRADFE